MNKTVIIYILFSLLFASSLSAQDNYTVVVKCSPISGQNGYMLRHSSRNGQCSYSLYTSSVVFAYENASYGSYTVNLIGYANFNISNLPTNFTIGLADITFNQLQSASSYHPVDIYGMSATPTTANSVEFTKLVSRTVYNSSNTSQIYTWGKDSYAAFAHTTCTTNKTYSQYLIHIPWGYTSAYTTSVGQASSTLSSLVGGAAYPTGTLTLSHSTFATKYHDALASMYTVSSTNNGAWSYSAGYLCAYYDIENARKSSKTDFGMAFSQGANSNLPGISAPTSAMCMHITYMAPWSCVLAPSVRTSASSACVGDGIISLTASQNNGSAYVPIVATKTWQWYSGTNGSNGTYATMGGTFTANTSHSTTVQAPANTGSVWYKYIQTIKITSNATCTPLGATSKTYTVSCRPASVAIVQCCSSLGGTLTFNGTQTGDRSVTLSWGGITNTNGILHYVISYGTGPTYKQIEVAANRNSIEIGNLTNGRTYHFEIQAIGKTGSPSYCNSNTINVNLVPICNE
ncbi:MAG: fibronectin type III domain-containing protein [Bacteroidales bacterium]|nr:fibronectin type III domain-containing protein [Bacteroidales bacterium]